MDEKMQSPEMPLAEELPDWHRLTNPERSKAKILLVDGEEHDRDALFEALVEEGYDVLPVGSGAEALQRLDRADHDLLITDLEMPEMDGIELLREAKGRFPKLDVIVTTDHASVETAVESMRLGALDYIPQPFDVELAMLVIEKALELRDLRRKAELVDYYLELARIDSLTGLYNYRFFLEFLEAELARAERQKHAVSLIMVDVDDFKAYNDSYGHLAGDLALRQLATLLSHNTRVYDLVARYGGEEFVIVAPETEKEEAANLSRRLARLVEEFDFDEEEDLPKGKFTVSAGLATYPDHADDWSELIEAADAALYEAKQAGGNQAHVFEPSGA